MLDKENISWEELYSQADNIETSKDIDRLKSSLSILTIR